MIYCAKEAESRKRWFVYDTSALYISMAIKMNVSYAVSHLYCRSLRRAASEAACGSCDKVNPRVGPAYPFRVGIQNGNVHKPWEIAVPRHVPYNSAPQHRYLRRDGAVIGFRNSILLGAQSFPKSTIESRHPPLPWKVRSSLQSSLHSHQTPSIIPT